MRGRRRSVLSGRRQNYFSEAMEVRRTRLVAEEAMPEFATSDSCFGLFNSTALGIKAGNNIGATRELYLKADRFIQQGGNNPQGAICKFTNLDLFTGVSATSVMLGYTFAFY